MSLRQNQTKFVCRPIRLQYFNILNNFHLGNVEWKREFQTWQFFSSEKLSWNSLTVLTTYSKRYSDTLCIWSTYRLLRKSIVHISTKSGLFDPPNLLNFLTYWNPFFMGQWHQLFLKSNFLFLYIIFSSIFHHFIDTALNYL